MIKIAGFLLTSGESPLKYTPGFTLKSIPFVTVTVAIPPPIDYKYSDGLADSHKIT